MEHLESLWEVADEVSKGPPTLTTAWEKLTLEGLMNREKDKLKGFLAELKTTGAASPIKQEKKEDEGAAQYS
jgi:hypothetical protein